MGEASGRWLAQLNEMKIICTYHTCQNYNCAPFSCYLPFCYMNVLPRSNFNLILLTLRNTLSSSLLVFLVSLIFYIVWFFYYKCRVWNAKWTWPFSAAMDYSNFYGRALLICSGSAPELLPVKQRLHLSKAFIKPSISTSFILLEQYD